MVWIDSGVKRCLAVLVGRFGDIVKLQIQGTGLNFSIPNVFEDILLLLQLI